ncbi:MAG: SDR family oxidoreductase, partial [Cyclobacteriaceae bacterium]|nr:SDR family oxidoreductase [Cyclobacteriaceae bacterium HetDA_MAG_MS6]
MKRFESKTALITGGASGIGQAIAINAAKEGARVIIADIDDRRAADTIDAIGAIEGASTAKYHKTDITDDQQVRGLIEFVSSQFNKLDYLCNSAGLQTYGTAETTSEQDWDLTMDVNLKSMFLVVKHAVPLIRAAGGGAIVNISSVQGLACQENVLAYATSKGAVIAMTRAMGMDY